MIISARKVNTMGSVGFWGSPEVSTTGSIATPKSVACGGRRLSEAVAYLISLSSKVKPSEQPLAAGELPFLKGRLDFLLLDIIDRGEGLTFPLSAPFVVPVGLTGGLLSYMILQDRLVGWCRYWSNRSGVVGLNTLKGLVERRCSGVPPNPQIKVSHGNVPRAPTKESSLIWELLCYQS